MAERLHADRRRIAASVAARVLARHPEWEDRHSERTRERGQENVAAQIDYLAGAVVAGAPEVFEQYARWAAAVLSARGVPRSFLADQLAELRGEMARYIEEEVPGAMGREATLMDRLFRAGLAALEVGPNGGKAGAADDDIEFQVERSFYLEAARRDDGKTALSVALEAMDSGATVTQVYRRILEPAQREIGWLWERGEINVTGEHTATAVTESVMDRLHTHLDTPRPWRGTALITAAPGEDHVLGARLVSHGLEADGWEVHFLGTPPSHDAVLTAFTEHDPALVGVSATVLFNLPAAADLVTAIRHAAGEDPVVLVGGSAFQDHPLWREIGADGRGTDLRDAVALAAELTAG